MGRQLAVRDIAISLARRSGTPLSRQLEDQLRESIRRGCLLQGHELPSTRALADDLDVSRGVVVRAYTQLAAEGYLELRQGATPRVRWCGARPAESRLSRLPRPRRHKEYSLLPGAPDLARFPRRQWLASLQAAMSRLGETSLEGADRGGIVELREELAAYLGRSRGVAARPENVVVTTGLYNGFELLAAALHLDGADRFAVETPSARPLHRALRRFGVTVQGLPTASAESALRVLETDPGAVVMSPTFRVRHPELDHGGVAAAVAAWAHERNGLVIEVDRAADSPERAAIVRPTREVAIACVGHLGATLSPAVRLGWLLLPATLAEAVARIQETSSPASGTEQLALADFLRRGELDRHLRRMRELNQARHDALVAALQDELPGTPVCAAPEGLQVMVELDSTAAEEAVARAMQAAGYEVDTVSRNSLPAFGAVHGLLVGYGCLPEPAIPAVASAVGRAVRKGGAADAGRPAA
jgi:GntR family transcriptional regulator/MocR family aminotransferase